MSGNQAGNTGGGLYLYNDAITITNTDVSNNTAVGRGGGIFFRDARGLTISGSTITGNSSTDNGGGGIWLYDSDAPATISDSTISANSAADSGGGIAAVETVALAVRSSTVSGNTALTGGGITFTGYYGLDVVQSTVTANTAARIDGIQLAGFTNTRDKSASAPASHKHDGPNATDGPRHTHTAAKGTIAVTLTGMILAGNGKTDLGTIGTASSDHSILGTVTGTTVTNLGGTITATDPVLGPLADNGGPTRTHALLPGSPAIDAGEVPVATFPGNDTDQRGTGYPRVVAGVVDIGAFEVQPVVIQPTFTG